MRELLIAGAVLVAVWLLAVVALSMFGRKYDRS